MRRMILVLTVLAFAGPVMAGVTITAVNEGIGITGDPNIGVVRIDYTSDANVSAFALEIELDSGATVNDVNDYFPYGECNSTNKGFGIFLDQTNGIVINSSGVVLDVGIPIVHSSSPDGVGTGRDKSKVILEMGALYEDGNQPPLSGTLCKIRYNSCNDCNLTVSGNARRGNVVLEDATEASVTYLPAAPGLALADTNEPNCYIPPLCDPVPDVVGMAQADANAAIIAAGYTVGSIGSQASAEPDGEVLSQDPVDGATPGCGSAVDIVVSDYECYFGQADYAQWEMAGKPTCWCYPRQCYGDADGLKQGSKIGGYYYVGSDDLDIMIPAWLVKDVPKGPGISAADACADFDHLRQGSKIGGYYRVGSDDLDIMIGTWLVKEPTKGPGIPSDCQPGNEVP